MKAYSEMNKKELHKELRSYKLKFQRIAKGEKWAEWIIFYSYEKRSFEIMDEMNRRGLKDYEHNLVWMWRVARDKAQAYLNKTIKW